MNLAVLNRKIFDFDITLSDKIGMLGNGWVIIMVLPNPTIIKLMPIDGSLNGLQVYIS